ncbi:MAG TPA: phenylacetic acid degradation protein PaaN, partial [Rhodopila sp.]
MSTPFETHWHLLNDAMQARCSRGYWSAFSEVPRTYGEGAANDGQAAFTALLSKPFDLGPSQGRRVGDEISPFGLKLGIAYAAPPTAALIRSAKTAAQGWAAASPETRTGIALESLVRLNRASFVIAHAVEHATGQAFPMAFQAGGPHAQDRGLEAVAYAFAEMTVVPRTARWEKPAGRSSIRLDKEFHIVPRGIGLVVGCATFPTWNSYPAIFANLVTGNTVIVKPHPAAILPLALTVRIIREVLTEQDIDPNVVQLAVDTIEQPLTKELAADPAIAMVDFTGSSAFGGWLRENLRDKLVFTEEAGVNTVVIDGTDSFAAMCSNIAFSLCLYSGQMCTTPQAIFVPRDGIDTDEGHKSFDEVARALAAAIDDLLADPARAAGVLGAIQNPATLARIAAARALGRVVRESAPLPV